MRVITGTARGRKLDTPENYDIRPTTDVVKEALFNIIQFDVYGKNVLDLFAGTGQLGIECLSRGAKTCTFVDKDRKAINIVKKNLAKCELNGDIEYDNAGSFLERCGKYDLIFIDPPYDTELYEEVLEKINKFDILTDGGIIICESRKNRQLPAVLPPYIKGKDYSYGKVKITIYRKLKDI